MGHYWVYLARASIIIHPPKLKVDLQIQASYLMGDRQGSGFYLVPDDFKKELPLLQLESDDKFHFVTGYNEPKIDSISYKEIQYGRIGNWDKLSLNLIKGFEDMATKLRITTNSI